MEAASPRMDEILNTIGDTIGGFFDNPIVQFAIQALVVYFVILWLAAAYWAFRDMQQRSENPVLPYLAAALIVLFTPVLFVFGIIVYRIIRPHEKIGEVYERNLAEEALLAEVEAIKTCPSCRRRVNDEWIICPTCRTQLNRVCANCGRLVGLDWALCAWCGRDFERARPRRLPAHRARRRPSDLDAPRRPRRPPSARARAPRSGRVRQPPSASRERTGHDPGALTEPAAPDPERRSRRARRRSASRAARSRRSTSSAGSGPSWASPSSSCRCSRAARPRPRGCSSPG